MKRFFKTTKEFTFGWDNKILPKGTVLSSSKFYKRIVKVSDGTSKTDFIYIDKATLFEKFITGDIKFLTKKELNKIKPHLKKEQLQNDL